MSRPQAKTWQYAEKLLSSWCKCSYQEPRRPYHVNCSPVVQFWWRWYCLHRKHRASFGKENHIIQNGALLEEFKSKLSYSVTLLPLEWSGCEPRNAFRSNFHPSLHNGSYETTNKLNRIHNTCPKCMFMFTFITRFTKIWLGCFSLN